MEDEAMEETETDEISPDSFYETMDEEDSNLKADSEIINGDNHQNLVKMIAQEDTTSNLLADNSLRSSVSQNLFVFDELFFLICFYKRKKFLESIYYLKE